jgi:hypothetical protein
MYSLEPEILGSELFVAGQLVAPGVYRQSGTRREVVLKEKDFLPASLDGKVACYMLISGRWGETEHTRRTRPSS